MAKIHTCYRMANQEEWLTFFIYPNLEYNLEETKHYLQNIVFVHMVYE